MDGVFFTGHAPADFNPNSGPDLSPDDLQLGCKHPFVQTLLKGYNDFTAPSQVRAFQVSNSKHQTCLILLIVAPPSTDAPQRNSRPGSVRNRMLKTCKVTFVAEKSKAYEPCLYRPLKQEFNHIVLFVFPVQNAFDGVSTSVIWCLWKQTSGMWFRVLDE